MKIINIKIFVILALLLNTLPALAQNRDSGERLPAHRVIGNLYAVGTYELSAYLVSSDEGHILINTGWADSIVQIRENVEALGFDFEDIRILLAQHSHGDHTGALAEIKEITGAEMWASAKDAPILEDGGLSDPHFGGILGFAPVEVDRILEEEDIIELGGNRLVTYLHPGHTEGATSFGMTVQENGREYKVLIANMGSVNGGKRLAVDPTYPGVAADFAYTFTAQKAMDVDVWVSAHADQYNMLDKWEPGMPYSPDTFNDPEGFLEKVEYYEQLFLEALATERLE